MVYCSTIGQLSYLGEVTVQGLEMNQLGLSVQVNSLLSWCMRDVKMPIRKGENLFE